MMRYSRVRDDASFFLSQKEEAIQYFCRFFRRYKDCVKFYHRLFRRMRPFLIVSFLLCVFQLGFAQDNTGNSFSGTLVYEVEFKGPVADRIRLNEPNTQVQMHIHQGDYIVNLTEGRYPKTYMYINKSDREYSLDVEKRLAYKYSNHEDINRVTDSLKPVAHKTDKEIVVQDIVCDVYRMEKDGAVIFFAVSDDYRVDTTLFEGKVQAKPNFLVDGLGGRIPLKTSKRAEGITVTTTCVSIQEREFDPSQFFLPEGFKIKNRDYRP